MQTRWESFKEVGWGTFIGLIGAWIITRLSMEFIDNRDIATTVSCLGLLSAFLFLFFAMGLGSLSSAIQGASSAILSPTILF